MADMRFFVAFGEVDSEQRSCPSCEGEKQTMAFVCGAGFGGVRALPCKTCNAKGWLSDEELAALEQIKAKHKERKAKRVALKLSVRDMADRLGIPFLKYNDYEHGRVDL